MHSETNYFHMGKDVNRITASYRFGRNTTGVCGADHAVWYGTRQEKPIRKPDKKTRQESSARKYNKQVLRREQILEFCVEPKSLFDILQHLGLKNRENLMEVYINPMIGAGALAMTEPDNPTSRNQMYVAVREDMDTCNSK